MKLDQIIQALDLTLLTKNKDFSKMEVAQGYTSDLLSCVMAGAPREGVWVTLQAHNNIVAVAALLDLNAVIITEDAQPEPATIERANEEDITLLATRHPTFQVVGMLWEMGLRAP